jgi:5'-deoxynucleotidase YfbR-like HD superfamily hydrolase
MTASLVQTNTLTRRIASALHIGKWELDEKGRIRRGEWMQSYSGRQLYPLDPLPEDVCFDDIAIGLSRECRYGRQCREFYSVAEHSVIVSLYVERFATQMGWLPGEVSDAALEGLLHDGSEAYLGDVPRPLKYQRAMRGYKKIEAKWTEAIYTHFGVCSTEQSRKLVKSVDRALLANEIDALMYDPDMWVRTNRDHGAGIGAEITGMSSVQALNAFCQRFAECYPDYLDTPETYGTVTRIPLTDAEKRGLSTNGKHIV